MTWVLASDVDGTLVGVRATLDRLVARLQNMRRAGELFLIMSTGRRLEQVIDGIAEEGLPEPDAVLCQVGTEIYIPPLAPDSRPLHAWREKLLAEYSRDEALSFLAGCEGLVMQPARFNTELKTSCFLDRCPDPEAAAAEIRRRVKPYAGRYQVVWSSSRDLDILPASSGKGQAIRFLVEHCGLSPDRVVVAGDTGNDATMFELFHKGVVVANAQPELVALAESLGDGRAYRARQPYAAGVEEGLEYFGVLAPKSSHP
jgi:sucrose-6F-phosphate phosphohydrolase